jgi:hypothetical protein
MSTTTTAPPKQDSADPVLERLHQLVRRAEGGDEAALPELRAALDVNPWVWERYGDLGRQSQAAWLQLIAGSNLMLHESTRRKVEQLKTELAGPGDSVLERLLIERILGTWLQVNYADAAYAQLKGATPAQHAASMRRQNSAQQRHVQALRALATARRLLKPGPSPLELLRGVAETSPAPPAPRRDAGLPLCGAGVED